jgi:hypothetical protein
VLGVVDIMDCIQNCGGKDGWRSVFSRAIEADDFSGSGSVYGSVAQSKASAPPVVTAPMPRAVPAMTPVRASPLPNNIPTTLEFQGLGDDTSTINDTRIESKSAIQESSVFGLSEVDGQQAVFKVVDPEGNTHRVRCELSVQRLRDALFEKGVARSARLEFLDDEGDTIVVSSDDCLAEAATASRAHGHKVIKLTAKKVELIDDSNVLLLAGVGAVVAAVGVLAFMFKRPRK